MPTLPDPNPLGDRKIEVEWRFLYASRGERWDCLGRVVTWSCPLNSVMSQHSNAKDSVRRSHMPPLQFLRVHSSGVGISSSLYPQPIPHTSRSVPAPVTWTLWHRVLSFCSLRKCGMPIDAIRNVHADWMNTKVTEMRKESLPFPCFPFIPMLTLRECPRES